MTEKVVSLNFSKLQATEMCIQMIKYKLLKDDRKINYCRKFNKINTYRYKVYLRYCIF